MRRKEQLLVGLTGGIASGKTEVSRELKILGALILSADEIGREVMDNEPGMLEWVKAVFGEQFFDAEGKLLRKKLGDLVFSQPEKKKALDDKIFPIIYKRLLDRIEDGFRQNKVIVVDAAMIFEWGIEREFDILLTVLSSEKDIKERLSERDGFDAKQISDRLASQLSPDYKAECSDWVIKNDGDLNDLKSQVRLFWEAVINK